MWKATVIGIAWGIAMRGIVAVPAWVFQAPGYVTTRTSIFATIIGGFLWYVMPPLSSNDPWVFGKRSRS